MFEISRVDCTVVCESIGTPKSQMENFWAQLFKASLALRGQLVKCFTTLYPNTLKFFVEKVREAFALREAFAVQKLLTFFQQKILANLGYIHLKF